MENIAVEQVFSKARLEFSMNLVVVILLVDIIMDLSLLQQICRHLLSWKK